MTYHYELPFLLPMMNGSKGLLRMHWAGKRAAKRHIYNAILARHLDSYGSLPMPAEHPVRVTVTRYSSQQPDQDNLMSQAKLLCDVMRCNRKLDTQVPIKHGWFLDDSSAYIEEVTLWEKAPRVKGYTTIDVEEMK